VIVKAGVTSNIVNPSEKIIVKSFVRSAFTKLPVIVAPSEAIVNFKLSLKLQS
jgi:hypothetical protein